MAKSTSRKQKSARNPRRRTGSPSLRRRRWLVLPLAMGIAAVAFYVLVTAGVPGGDPPQDHISASSRQSLERVLRDAERAEEASR